MAELPTVRVISLGLTVGPLFGTHVCLTSHAVGGRVNGSQKQRCHGSILSNARGER